MQTESKKKIFVIASSFLGGVIVTLLLVWLTASSCPCKKHHDRAAMRRASIERRLEMQNRKRGPRRGAQAVEEAAEAGKALPQAAPAQ